MSLTGFLTSPASGENLIWRGYTVAERITDGFPSPWPKRDIALLHDRYPLVVYLSSDLTQLRSIQWVDGVKSDITAVVLGGQISNGANFSVTARDDQASLVFSAGGNIQHARFNGSQWSAPETIAAASTFGTVYEVIVDIDPRGNPVVATRHGSGMDGKIVIHERIAGVWTSTPVPNASPHEIGAMSFVLTQSGEKRIAYNSIPYPRYLTETNGIWSNRAFPYSVYILKMRAAGENLLFLGQSTPSGFPYSKDTVIGSIDGSTWSDLKIVPAEGREWDLATTGEGHIHVLFGSLLATLREGNWIVRPAPESSEAMIADDEGSVHVLGGTETQISYHVASANPWRTLEVTPPDGGNYLLEGLVIDSQQRPVVLAYDFSGAMPAFTSNDDSWTRKNLNIADFYQPEFAFDSAGNLHAFSDPIYNFNTYAVGAIPNLTPGVVTTQKLSGGSNHRQSLFVDPQNRPHVSFAIQHDDVYDYYYGTKNSSTWNLEKVVTTNTSGYPHSAVTVTPSGTVFVFTPEGLYRKSGANWTRQFATVEPVYPFSKATHPVLVCGPDSTVYGLYMHKGSLFGFSGSGSNYSIEPIFRSDLNEPTSLTYTPNGPVGAFLDSGRTTLQIATKTPGNSWMRQIIEKIPTRFAFGTTVHIASAANGTLHLAATKEYRLNDSNIRHQLVTYRLGPITNTIEDHGLTLWKGDGAKIGLRSRLLFSFESNPVQIQTSENLTSWSPAFDLKNPPSVTNTTYRFRGNGFQTDIMLPANASKPKTFYRLAQGSAIISP